MGLIIIDFLWCNSTAFYYIAILYQDSSDECFRWENFSTNGECSALASWMFLAPRIFSQLQLLCLLFLAITRYILVVQSEVPNWRYVLAVKATFACG